MTHTDAAQLVALVTAYWPTPALPPASQRAYADAIGDLDRDAVFRGLATLRDTQDYPPSIAAIRKAAGWQPPTAALPAPEEVTALVFDQAARRGFARGFAPPVGLAGAFCAAVVAGIGWEAICHETAEYVRPRVLRAARELRETWRDRLAAGLPPAGELQRLAGVALPALGEGRR